MHVPSIFFDIPLKFAIKADQINALAYHNGGSALVTQITHP